MHKYFLTLSLCLTAVTAQAQDLIPIDITAESLDLEQKKGYAVFKGDVKVEHGAMKLGSQSLEVFYATSGGGTTDSAIDKILAEGKVTIVSGKDTATGEKAIYHPSTGNVELTGDVVMVRDGNILKGESLVYDTKTRRLKLNSAKGEKKGRVKATFSLKDAGLNETRR